MKDRLICRQDALIIFSYQRKLREKNNKEISLDI